MAYIIPIFIPHEGCPHRCLFCNQRRLIGGNRQKPVTAAQVKAIVSTWLDRAKERPVHSIQTAFYGGSFTALTANRQRELLGAVLPFLHDGAISTIRLSTRPDAIDPGKVQLLRDHGVSIVELGVQSMDDQVLAATGRGYKSECVPKAAEILCRQGMKIGIQIMVGLPRETRSSLRRTCRQIRALKPHFVRIYPLLVLKQTPLVTIWKKGHFQPLSLAQAVLLTAAAYKYFTRHRINVIRMGLQPTMELEKNLLAGPFPPGFGELVHSRIMLQQVTRYLKRLSPGSTTVVAINHQDQSIFRGWRNSNIKRLNQLGLADRFHLRLVRNQPRFTICFPAAS